MRVSQPAHGGALASHPPRDSPQMSSPRVHITKQCLAQLVRSNVQFTEAITKGQSHLNKMELYIYFYMYNYCYFFFSFVYLLWGVEHFLCHSWAIAMPFVWFIL